MVVAGTLLDDIFFLGGISGEISSNEATQFTRKTLDFKCIVSEDIFIK